MGKSMIDYTRVGNGFHDSIASWDSVRAVRSRRPAPSSRRRVFLSPRLSCVRKPLLRTVSSTVTLRSGASFALADAVLLTLGLSRASRLGASHLPWLGVCAPPNPGGLILTAGCVIFPLTFSAILPTDQPCRRHVLLPRPGYSPACG